MEGWDCSQWEQVRALAQRGLSRMECRQRLAMEPIQVIYR